MSPILLNGESYKLYFSRQYPSGKVTLIGVLKNDGNVTLPNNDLKSLKKGDVVIPVYYYANAEIIEEIIKNDSPISIESMTPDEQRAYIESFFRVGKSITIGDKPILKMEALYNGTFGYAFYFVNPAGKNVISDEGVACKIKKDKIVAVKEVYEMDDFRDLED